MLLPAMKRPRGLKVFLVSAGVATVVTGFFVVFNWAIVRDHIESWWFVMSRTTETILPNPIQREDPTSRAQRNDFPFLRLIADFSGRPVIFELTDGLLASEILLKSQVHPGTADAAKLLLQADGWRIVQQYFPRPAYVIISYPEQSSLSNLLLKTPAEAREFYKRKLARPPLPKNP
jgi:hypothetical protein